MRSKRKQLILLALLATGICLVAGGAVIGFIWPSALTERVWIGVAPLWLSSWLITLRRLRGMRAILDRSFKREDKAQERSTEAHIMLNRALQRSQALELRCIELQTHNEALRAMSLLRHGTAEADLN